MEGWKKLSDEEIRHLPSRSDGIRFEEEKKMRKEAIKWISKTGESLKMQQFTIATASVFFHRFYSRYSLKEFSRRLVACTCLFLAAKTEETRKKLDDVIDHFNYVIYVKTMRAKERPAKNSKEFQEFRRNVVKMEMQLMEALEFQFYVVHPYHLLVEFLKKLFPDPEDSKAHVNGPKGLAQTAWFFVNDSLRSMLCLSHDPSKIALTAIYLALKHKKIDYDKLKKRTTPWYLEYGIQKEQLESLGEIIIEAYGEANSGRPRKEVRLSAEEMKQYQKMNPEEKKLFLKNKRAAALHKGSHSKGVHSGTKADEKK